MPANIVCDFDEANLSTRWSGRLACVCRVSRHARCLAAGRLTDRGRSDKRSTCGPGRFGRIATALREKGTPIPTNDIWIAAQAMETGVDLLSSDAHFGLVEGLAWVSFSPRDDNSVRERVRKYHAARGE